TSGGEPEKVALAAARLSSPSWNAVSTAATKRSSISRSCSRDQQPCRSSPGSNNKGRPNIAGDRESGAEETLADEKTCRQSPTKGRPCEPGCYRPRPSAHGKRVSKIAAKKPA